MGSHTGTCPGTGNRPVLRLASAASRVPRAGKILALLTCAAALLRCATAAPVAATPDWVEHHGKSARFASAEYLTGYGVGSGEDAVAQAKQQAAADLARKISVRVESELTDVSQERDGDYSYKVSAITRSTSDIRLANLAYEEPYEKRGRVHVLAWVNRRAISNARADERDRAISELRACLAAAERERDAERKHAAEAAYQSCRRPLAEALQHDAIANALRPSGARDLGPFKELAAASKQIDHEVEAIRLRPSINLEGASDAMALQLANQGVSTATRLVVAHFNYGSTNLSSSFGRQAGIELERALARAGRQRASVRGMEAGADLAVSGVYIEIDDQLRLVVTAREVASGRLVASAEATLPVSAIPEQLDVKPANFAQVLEDQRVLAEGGLVSGELQVEIWTDRGRGGVLYAEHDEMRFFMRVNRPAWVRLLYVLQDGTKLLIDQAHYIDASKANMVVEYYDAFEIVPPFGVELLHVMAFTDEPPALETHMQQIEGVTYEVLSGGLRQLQRTRGLIRKKEKSEMAEDTVAITTTPRL